MKLANLESTSSFRGGSNYGVRGYLVYSDGVADLVWYPGHSEYMDRGAGTIYVQSALRFHKLGNPEDRLDMLYISKGGSLKKSLSDNFEKITKLFGHQPSLIYGQTVRAKKITA